MLKKRVGREKKKKKKKKKKKPPNPALWHEKSLRRLLQNGHYGAFSEPSRWDKHEYGVKSHFLQVKSSQVSDSQW